MTMSKEEVIKILEDYEFFVDDDWGGHYEHINCSQRALTPLGIVEILDYITNLEQQVKKQKQLIDDFKEDISNLLDIICKNCNELKCTSDEWLVIQKYQDKEVLE